MSLKMDRICDVCAQRVGKNTDAIQRERDGGWDHAACHTEYSQRLRTIFGESVGARSREASRQLANQSGHSISINSMRRETNRVWVILHCTCGWHSPWTERHLSSKARAAHYPDAAMDATI